MIALGPEAIFAAGRPSHMWLEAIRTIHDQFACLIQCIFQDEQILSTEMCLGAFFTRSR